MQPIQELRDLTRLRKHVYPMYRPRLETAALWHDTPRLRSSRGRAAAEV